LIAALLTIWVYSQLGKRVGDIHFDSNLDSTDFSLCDEGKVFQYYSIGTEYRGGKKTIKEQLQPIIQTNGFPTNGLLTVRFVVNCHGEAGYFRTKMIDPSLNDVEVSSVAMNHLHSLISGLKDWVPGQVQGKARDSYVQISFKLEQGKVTDIF
jgi:hypothetical protein